MSTLNQAFDVVRGWPDYATIEEDFRPHSSVPANDPLVEGDIVYQESDGNAARATSEDYGGAADLPSFITLLTERNQLWLVVSGTTPDNYDGLKQGDTGSGFGYVPWKVVAIRGTYMFKTEEFVARAYNPGEPVAAVSGKVDRIPGDNPGLRQYGEVREYDSANGVLTVTVSC